MDLAVDEVALERLREAEEEAGSARFHDVEPGQERVPIEAPRAPRTGSNLSTSALTPHALYNAACSGPVFSSITPAGCVHAVQCMEN